MVLKTNVSTPVELNNLASQRLPVHLPACAFHSVPLANWHPCLRPSLATKPSKRNLKSVPPRSNPNTKISNNKHGIYSTWFDRLNQLVQQLSTATRDQHHDLEQLVTQTLTHYTEYYRVKSAAAERDVLSVFAAPWASTLERSLHWIVGWRPTTLFHLLYSESSILFESHIDDILRGLRTGRLGDLSPSQLRRVSELQCETVKDENAITDELSEWQDGASELLSECTSLGGKLNRLVGIVHKADELRMRTVRRVVKILTTQQAVEFLIAAAELQHGIRKWGRGSSPSTGG